MSDLSGLLSNTETLFLRSQDGFHFGEGSANLFSKRLEGGLDLGGERGSCVLENATSQLEVHVKSREGPTCTFSNSATMLWLRA
jgi:hypothetical protein